MPPGTNNARPSVLTLKELRETLPSDERRMIRDQLQHIERHLILALPEMKAGVLATRSQSSMTPTIAMTPKGKTGNNIKVRTSCRVRAEREALEGDYHLTEDGQLVLGLEDVKDDGDDEIDGEADTEGPGFDDSPDNAPSGLH